MFPTSSVCEGSKITKKEYQRKRALNFSFIHALFLICRNQKDKTPSFLTPIHIHTLTHVHIHETHKNRHMWDYQNYCSEIKLKWNWTRSAHTHGIYTSKMICVLIMNNNNKIDRVKKRILHSYAEVRNNTLYRKKSIVITIKWVSVFFFAVVDSFDTCASNWKTLGQSCDHFFVLHLTH